MTTTQALHELALGRIERLYLVKPGSFGVLVTYDAVTKEFVFAKPWRLISPSRPAIHRKISITEMLFQTQPLAHGSPPAV